MSAAEKVAPDYADARVAQIDARLAELKAEQAELTARRKAFAPHVTKSKKI
jgi:hypothetical protein